MKTWVYSLVILFLFTNTCFEAFAEESSTFADLQEFVSKGNYKFPMVIDKVTMLTSVKANKDLSLEYNYKISTNEFYKYIALDLKKARMKSKIF